VGYKGLLSFRPSQRAEVLADPAALEPLANVIVARKAAFAQLVVVYAAGLGVFAWLVARVAVRATQPWLLACAGAMAVPLFLSLSCYYESALVAGVLLVAHERRVGAWLCAACAIIAWLNTRMDNDDFYALSSALLIVVAAATLVVLARRRPPTPRGAALGWIAPAIVAAAGAIALSHVSRDPMMALDAECEARWTDFTDALEARLDVLASPSPATRDAVKRAAAIRLRGGDFADELKVVAFVEAQATAAAAADAETAAADRARFDEASARVDETRAAYARAVTRFDDALADTRDALDRATGEPFAPRAQP
jgi:hypothetical protein